MKPSTANSRFVNGISTSPLADLPPVTAARKMAAIGEVRANPSLSPTQVARAVAMLKALPVEGTQ